jgi:uncharacterized protein
LLAAAAASFYVSKHFDMDSRSEDLISANVPWRQREAAFDRAFPQRNNLTLVVIDGVTPERTQEAAAALRKALMQRPDIFPVVRDIQGEPFFAKNGLLYLPVNDVRETTAQLIAAQPFLGPLTADPSLRGIMDGFSAALMGVENGQGSLEQLSRPFSTFADVFETILAGRPAFMSWRTLLTGESPSLRDTRHLIEVQGVLDYGKLEPGGAASRLIRKIAADLHLAPDQGVRVRLTGPVPLADEEFATLAERAALIAALMLSAILLTLWLAVRSAKIIVAILITLFAGFALTTAAGLLVFGTFNLISIAFIPLFVGIGVDFQIQYAVRYRAERHALGELREALLGSGARIGSALTLAALATAACFFSFIPTDYSGLAELGLVAGIGMILAFLLSGTMLPALMRLFNPKDEMAEIGFARLAPVDRFLQRRGREVLIGAGIIVAIGLAILPLVNFDPNPLHLRSTRTESMSTLLDLMKNPDTSPNTLDALAPSPDAADRLASRLATLPEVDRTLTVKSFIPDRQPEKLALISDASSLLDTALDPLEVKPPPNQMEILLSMAETEKQLRRVAGMGSSPGGDAAKRLADTLARLRQSPPQILSAVNDAVVPGLKITLEQIRTAMMAGPVNLESLPIDLTREWIAQDGQARVQVSPKGNGNDNTAMKRFSEAVQVVAPDATGAPIAAFESGHTIIKAFTRAGILSLVAMILLLAISLRRFRDVVLTVIPLLVIGILTFATCAALGLQLNFANIIVLPLLFGIGVAFNIYFVMFWRRGGRDFLQSSLARAVIYSAVTTASGFGALWLSSHPGTASMGELLMISLAWTLVTTLLFVPALLNAATPRR